MIRSEQKFLEILEKKSQEERKVVESGILPEWASIVGFWLGVHPWRVLVPVSGLLYLGMRAYYGVYLRELILALFGGFR